MFFFTSVALGVENGQSYYHNKEIEPTSQCWKDTLAAYSRLAKEFPQIRFHLQVAAGATHEPQSMGAAVVALANMGNQPNICLGLHMAPMSAQHLPATELSKPHAPCIGSLFAAADAPDPWNERGIAALAVPQTLSWNGPLATISAKTRQMFVNYLNQSYDKAIATGARRPFVILDADISNFGGISVMENAEFAEILQIEAMIADATA